MQNNISHISSDDSLDCDCGICATCVQREFDYLNAKEEKELCEMLYREDRAQEIADQRRLDGVSSDDDDDGDEEDPHGAHPIDEPDEPDEPDELDELDDA
jgi:hypothetical protein